MKQDNIQSRVDKGWDIMNITLDRKMPQKRKRRGLIWWTLGIGITVTILSIVLTHTMAIENNTISKLKHQLAETNSTVSNSKELSTNNNPKVSRINKVEVNTHTDKKESYPKLVTTDSIEQNSKTLKPLNQEEKESIAFNNNKNQFLQQSEIEQISNNRYENINEDSEFIDKINDRPQSMFEGIGNPQISTQSLKHIIPIHLLNVQINPIASDDHYSVGNPTNLSPTNITINSNKHSPVSIKFTFGVGTDYLYKPKAFGLSPSLGFNLSKRKFSLNTMVSYTRAFNKRSELASPDNVLSLAHMDRDSTINVINVRETMDSGLPHYISIGINLQYKLGGKLSIIGGFGREFHLGSQVFNTFLEPGPTSLSNIFETITIDHQNTNYIESGINYNITPRLSLEANYRYVINSYLDISNDEINKNSAKISFNIRYNL